jgi:hypothetical protein
MPGQAPDKKYAMPPGKRRERLLKKAAKIPDRRALDIILRSFPEAQRAQLLEEIRPSLCFPCE